MRIVCSWRHALNTHLEDKKCVINVNETNGFVFSQQRTWLKHGSFPVFIVYNNHELTVYSHFLIAYNSLQLPCDNNTQ